MTTLRDQMAIDVTAVFLSPEDFAEPVTLRCAGMDSAAATLAAFGDAPKHADLLSALAGGVVEGRRSTVLLARAEADALAVAAVGRPLQRNDQVVVTTGDNAGVWTIETLTPVWGSGYEAVCAWERLAAASGGLREATR